MCIRDRDTYLRIVLEIHTYKRDENPSAWIIRILKSIIFTKLKKQKREVSMEDARLERRGMYSSRGSEEYIENYLLTRKVFEHLNDYDRDLVMLHWWFDNSFGEIALLYNKPKSTIQSLSLIHICMACGIGKEKYFFRRGLGACKRRR